MGGSAWSDDFYSARADARASKGIDSFDYSKKVMASHDPDKKVAHDKLDPKKMKVSPKTGNNVRESRDSDAHPTSLSIAVFFDVTGSMSGVPIILQKKLPKLMNLLIKKGYVEHPQILNGAIGDAHSDRIPLQVGQFESGVEMDDDINNIVLEGGGGGTMQESYELGAYLLANHTEIDCFEKRGEKGYAFFIGDELPYPTVKRELIESLLGQRIEKDIKTEEVFGKLKERYNVFFIIPKGTQHFDDEDVLSGWRKLVGQNLIKLENPEDVAETIALAIGMNEGKIDIDDGTKDLKDVGASASTVRSVSTALAPLASSGTLAKKATNIGGTALADIPDDGDKSAKRL